MKKKNRIVSATGALLASGFALLLTGQLSAGEADAKAEKAIKAMGGSVFRDQKAKGKPIVVVYLGASKVTDAGLKELADLTSLQTLLLDSTDVTDAGLKELSSLKS